MDIVDRLHDIASRRAAYEAGNTPIPANASSAELNLAAAEIARLRQDKADAATEIERLRAALQDIAIGCGDRVLSQQDMRARAFDALNQQDADQKP